MNKTKKVFMEVLSVLIILLIAGIIILVLFTKNVVHSDTFKGSIAKKPINITSPVYGQITSLPVHEGERVQKGQTLAILHVLNASTMLVSSPLYRVAGLQLSVKSPVNGIVGQIAFATFSTVAGAGSLMYLYTADSLDVQILLPNTVALTNYTRWYAERLPDKTRYPLRIEGQIPTNVLANIDPTTSVYRATCTTCEAIIDNESITIIADRKETPSPLIDGVRAILKNL